MEHMFGDLLEFGTTDDFNAFIEKMNRNDAIALIETALTHCQQNGIFTIEESYTIYKSLKKLKENGQQ